MRRSLLAGVFVLLAACSAPSAPAPAAAPDPADWDAVLAAARGQTLDWYLYGSDDAVNTFVDGYVSDRLAEDGITLNPVRITDTADAVNKVLAEQQAGRTTDGTVDAIWINGANFATGKQAGLWFCGYPGLLPNARFVDLTDPAVANDFGVPVEGCEAAWQRANSALVYDSARLAPTDVASLTALSGWAQANPGRFTYPAPPDFTGSMVVRTFLYDTARPGEPDVRVLDPLWERLDALEPALWRGGETYPTSQEAVEQLYATGEISAYFTYGPGTVGSKVADGVYPATTREAVPDVGNIGNVSNIAVPVNSPDRAAALVLANLLQDPQSQLRFFADGGIYPVIELDRTPSDVQAAFAAVPRNPSVLPLDELTANARPELDAAAVGTIDDGWTTRVLQQ